MTAGLSPAASDLGLGTDLSTQVKDETDEERKKRLQSMRGSQLSPGALALLGPGMGLTSGGY